MSALAARRPLLIAISPSHSNQLMSVNVGYYFNNTIQPLHEFANEVNSALGCSLAPYEGDYTDFYCRFFAMEFTLGHNELETDRELNFNDYRYFLDLRIPAPDIDLLDIAVQTMVAVAYVLHARLGIHDGLLVWDVQSALAKYSLRHDERNAETWYDSVSGKAVTFPEHLDDILRR